MKNVLDNENGVFGVLVNAEGEHSLWPDFAAIPDGWRKVHNGSRDDCLEYVREHWTDMRPKSVIGQTRNGFGV